MKQHGTRPRPRERADRNEPHLVQGIANTDVTLWLAISTAVESLSWDEVELNEVGVERGARMAITAINDRVIFPAPLIGQFTMTPDELFGKCAHCKGRDEAQRAGPGGHASRRDLATGLPPEWDGRGYEPGSGRMQRHASSQHSRDVGDGRIAAVDRSLEHGRVRHLGRH
jgi:hypothetical protein